MSCALIIALCVNMATAAVYEWKGVFYTPEKMYKWGAEKVSGKYADPAMKLAAIPVTAATEATLTGATNKGTAALGTQCVDVQKGGTITPAEGKCYRLVFDAQSSKTVFHVDATNANNIAFFAEHLPTEFEATEHYFKDTTGVDIEPQAQHPKAGDGHAHGHGGTDNFEGKCVCQAQANNWKLDCSNKAKVEAALANLNAKAACKAKGPPKDCIDNYYVMQAHHDHCLHDQLPTGIEKKLHDYEHFYTDCFVKRQFSAALSQCPTVDCANAQAMTAAITTLQGGCKSAQLCASTACSAAIKTVLMAHDTCPENKLPNNLETALHDYEGHCAAQLCNSASAAFDPYDEKCSANVVSGGFGSRDNLLVTTSVLPLAVLLFL
jgi:hypothetical protein